MSDFYSDWGMPSWDDVPKWLKITGLVIGCIVVAGLIGMVLLNLKMTGKPF